LVRVIRPRKQRRVKKHGKKNKQKAKLRGASTRGQDVITLERRAVAVVQRPSDHKPVAPRAIPVAAASAYSPAYSHDDRMALSLLMLPFLVMAFAIGSSQMWRNRHPGPAAIAHRMPASAPVQTPFARPTAPMANAPVVVATAPQGPVIAGTRGANTAMISQSQPRVESAPGISSWPVVTARMPSETAVMPGSETTRVAPSELHWPVVSATVLNSGIIAQVAPVTPLSPSLPGPVAKLELPRAAPIIAAAPAVSDAIAPSSNAPVLATSASNRPEIVAMLVPDPAAPLAPAKPDVPENSCIREATVKHSPAFFLGDAVSATTIDAGTFGRALAAAAREQLDDFTVYTDKYQTLKYPMGDLPAFYGVCTDVIVRAYRELGVDLQELVHVSKLGGGDTNIDHRRVTTLQKFFAKFGDELPITEFGEDYLPGDIVSYFRPQNAHSRTHIAVVSDVAGPSGQLMIIHNRGWGPQIEDGLFVDQITGHYRYSGANRPNFAPAAVASTTKKSMPTATSVPPQVKKVKRAIIPNRVTQGASLAPPKIGSIQR
jgi:uncharacterized protein YijF (DUF1287 family)